MDLLIGPGQTTTSVSLPGAAVFEIRSGEGVFHRSRSEEAFKMGAAFALDEGEQFSIVNRLKDRNITIRVVLVKSGDRKKDEDDPNVKPNDRDLQEDRENISPPTLQYPIYECASSVVVKNFIPGAKLEVFLPGNPTPIGGAVSWLSRRAEYQVSVSFATGQVVTAKQTFGGITSGHSNAVPVISHLEDYPSGLPQPRLAPIPLYECGRAVGIRDVIPGAWTKVFTEKPLSGGGFGPPVQIGQVTDFPYAILTEKLIKDARVWIRSGICSKTSPKSEVEIVKQQPGTIPRPQLSPVHEGVNIVTVLGARGNPNPLLNGATLDIFADDQPPGMERVGGSTDTRRRPTGLHQSERLRWELHGNAGSLRSE